MLPAFTERVASLDLCAAVRRTKSKRGREQVPLERAHIVSLPGFRSGKDLYLLRFPQFLLAAGRVFWDEVPEGALDGVEVVSLVERFGEERAMTDVLACVEDVVRESLSRRGARR